ncbi:ASCH domain-containing protein [Paenibacillus sp. ACRRX]|uniref:ASCH domain-containing protein n=1 Tax=unclassified Paenibacillus TaxID=185978 RepID=UPI001EF6A7A3|nr:MULTISPECIES: ASCH domain-containing protein [unclassified Paenibacillus]MCG7406758.1 ASCH domain-containing protein [Paenibacillus sp. ACRRX]MDK8182091.1 ASCH domain-containing protein [Paenibacillus sp. UMB4589-SE434]
MKAITIIQPWATLIAIGEKKFETRSWATKHRGPLAIHAGKKIDQEVCMMEPIKSTLAKHGYTADNLPTGAVVAVAQLTGSYMIYDTIDNGVHIVRCPDNQYDFDKVEFIRKPESDFGYYSEGRYAWEMSDVKKMKPVAAKGQQGLWNWEEES